MTNEESQFTLKDKQRIMARDKHLPKSPYCVEKEYYYKMPCFHECPNCCSGVIKEFEYCPHCGQRLDWSEK